MRDSKIFEVVLLFALVLFTPDFLIAKKVRIVVPHCSFYDFAKSVVGEEGDVEYLADGRYNLHYVEPRPSYIPKLRRANFVIPIGLGLDMWFDALIQASGNPKIMPESSGYIRVAGAIKVLEIPEFEIGQPRYGDIHPEGNPHYWLSPENAERIVLVIGEHLSKTLGDDKFRKNSEAYAEKLRMLGDELRSKFERFRGFKFISYHKSWSYFADFLGFEVVDTLEPAPGIPPTAQHVAKVIDTIKRLGIKVLLYEPYFSKDVVVKVEKQTGIRGVILYQDCVPSISELKDYFSLMRFNTERIIEVLRE